MKVDWKIVASIVVAVFIVGIITALSERLTKDSR